MPPERRIAAVRPRGRRRISVMVTGLERPALLRRLPSRAGRQQARSNEGQAGREAPSGKSGEAVAAAQVLSGFLECPDELGVGDPYLRADPLAAAWTRGAGDFLVLAG